MKETYTSKWHFNYEGRFGDSKTYRFNPDLNIELCQDQVDYDGVTYWVGYKEITNLFKANPVFAEFLAELQGKDFPDNTIFLHKQEGDNGEEDIYINYAEVHVDGGVYTIGRTHIGHRDGWGSDLVPVIDATAKVSFRRTTEDGKIDDPNEEGLDLSRL